MSVDWDEINSKLPFARTKVSTDYLHHVALIVPISSYFHHHHGYAVCVITVRDHEEKTTSSPPDMQEDYAARKELWEAVDVNGNGFLSLAEVTKVLIVIVIIIFVIFVTTVTGNGLPWLFSVALKRVRATLSLQLSYH